MMASADEQLELPDAADGAAPPPPPRQLTPALRRRSWQEPHVRFWWLGALVLLAIAGWFAVDQGREWAQWRWLIRHGQQVTAEVIEVGGISRNAMMAPNSPVKLSFELQGQPYTVGGILEGRTEFIRTHDRVPIYIDPADPSRWTALMELPPLGRQLLAVWITAPLGLVLLVGAVIGRNRLLRLYRQGQAEIALVLNSQHSALAPRSRLVRCTLRDEGDNRVFSVFVPQRRGAAPRHDENPPQREDNPPRGQGLWIIRSGNRAIAAEWFASSS